MVRMRWFMRSRASIGMVIVSTVAKAQIAVSMVTMKVGLMKVSIRCIAGPVASADARESARIAELRT